MTITTADLTEATLSGGGVFDELMRANKAHLDEEYGKNRIRGPEYSQVYLGALQSAMQYSIQFLLEKDRAAAQAALIEEQANTERKQQLLLDAQISKAAKEEELIDQQILSATEEVALVQARVALTQEQTESEAKQNEVGGILDAQKAQIEAQTALTSSQEAQVVAETANVPKQGTLLDAQAQQVSAEAALATRRLDQVDEEILLAKEQVLLGKEEVKIATAKLANIPLEGNLLTAQVSTTEAEALRVQAQTDLLAEQKASEVRKHEVGGLIDKELEQVDAQIGLVTQQTTNAATENTVLVAQECKLRGEFDVLTQQVTKTANEAALLSQKKVTETAQVNGSGVAPDSYLGRRMALYQAQGEGFKRDAEQKAAKVLVDAWNVKRSTDVDNTPANGVNHLDDGGIGRAVSKLLSGVGA